MVGFDTSDDACVYRISGDLAMIQTVDFFPPMVDDPYLFGQIAACNALSDVYAMGGEPKLALNLLCVTSCLGKEVVGEILRGGADKALEAGCTISGGHTIEDPVPKYGLSVTGFAHPSEILRNTGARQGDVVVLTKPLGTGILLTALKADFIEMEQCREMFALMATLNAAAAQAARGLAVHACTDITGFGLLGHLYEMASGGDVTIRIQAGRLPLLPHAQEMAAMGMVPGGAYRNLEYVKPYLAVSPQVSRELLDIAGDPQTSGGLCFALPEEDARRLVQRLARRNIPAWVVGDVTAASSSVLELMT